MIRSKAIVCSASVFFTLVVVCLRAQSSDPKADLEQKLQQSFPQTRFSTDKTSVVTAGAVVILQKDKFMGYAVASPMPPVNTYKNGRITQGMGGFGRDLLITTMASGAGTANDYPHQTFGTGQLLWVARVTVANDHISFILWSDPDDNNLRYYGELRIPFRKGSIPSPDNALQSISEVLKLQAADNSAVQQQAAAPGESSTAPPPSPPPAADSSAPSPPASAPPPPPPPPSDAGSAPPKTLSLGQTKGQVVASFGQPQKVVQLGAKEIDYYPGMKVTFVNGKVTDVQ